MQHQCHGPQSNDMCSGWGSVGL